PAGQLSNALDESGEIDQVARVMGSDPNSQRSGQNHHRAYQGAPGAPFGGNGAGGGAPFGGNGAGGGAPFGGNGAGGGAVGACGERTDDWISDAAPGVIGTSAGAWPHSCATRWL